jgi:4-aminobutyrate--pyruvate transaminase
MARYGEDGLQQRGNSMARRDVAAHLHPFTNLKQHEIDGPLIVDRGEGIHIVDDTGRRYIEGMSGLWCASLGFSEPRLVAAAQKQMTRLPYSHAFRGRSHEPAIALAEQLVALFAKNGAPGRMSKAFFANSGSEANDTAVKLVWYYNNALNRPNKRKIIGRQGGYHGTTVATSSLTGLPDLHRDFNLPIPGIVYTDNPHYWRHARPGESEEEFSARLADNLESLILREGPETVAAFIAEPVMGVGAVIVPPRGYFEKIQAVLRKYDVLFIADEVICAFGRTGNMFGCETFAIRPDMVTVAKALSSAYFPISALLVGEPIYRAMVAESEKIGLFGHGYTYSSHPVAAAVALEALAIYRERDIVGHVRKVAPRLQQGLRALADRPLVGEVRGVGLMAGVELVADKKSRAPFAPKGRAGAFLMNRAQEHGLIVRAIGDAVVMAPPLIIAEAEIDDLLRRFGRALEDTEREFAKT